MTPGAKALLTYTGMIVLAVVFFHRSIDWAADSLLAGMVMYNLIRLFQIDTKVAKIRQKKVGTA